MKRKLYTWEDCYKLSINEVHSLYKKFVNPGQVDLISTFQFGKVLPKKALGMYITTSDGKKILDFTGGIAVLNHGHNHPRILKAREAFQKKLIPEVHKNFFSPYIAGLSSNIANLLPGGLNTSYFCNSGAEAVEGAVKLAYKFYNGKRKTILRADIAFHGKLLGAAGLTGSPELRFQFPTIPNIKTFKYNSIDSVKKLIHENRNKNSSDIYAIIVEPFNASSLKECSKEFLLELRKITKKENIILIFDEVYTGWGKCGNLFYFMNHDVVPDIVTYAKSFGGGKASISGYTTRMEIFKKAYGNLSDAILHSTTYNGFGEETITAIEAINIIVEDDYIGKSRRIHTLLNVELNKLKTKYPELILDVRGCGSLNGIILNNKFPLKINKLLKLVPSELFKDDRFMSKLITGAVISDLYNSHRILTFYGDNKEIPLKISPSLIVSDKELMYFVNSLDKVLSQGIFKLIAKFVMQKWS